MKRFFVACVFVLLFVGGSEAATLDIVQPNVILKYGQVGRVANTLEVCVASRVGYTLNSEPKKIAPFIACWPSRKGPPIVGSHVNIAMWMSGNLIPGYGQWSQTSTEIYLVLNPRFPWQYETAVDPIIWVPGKAPFKTINSAQQASWTIGFPVVQGKRNREVILKAWSSVFAPEGAEKAFACGIQISEQDDPVWGPKGTTVLDCDYQWLTHKGYVTLSNMFWAPWGPTNLRLFRYNTDPNCVNSEGTLGCGPQVIYPSP